MKKIVLCLIFLLISIMCYGCKKEEVLCIVKTNRDIEYTGTLYLYAQKYEITNANKYNYKYKYFVKLDCSRENIEYEEPKFITITLCDDKLEKYTINVENYNFYNPNIVCNGSFSILSNSSTPPNIKNNAEIYVSFYYTDEWEKVKLYELENEQKKAQKQFEKDLEALRQLQ